MSDVEDFDDLKNEIKDERIRNILERMYGDIRNIDIWVGGILEDSLPDSKLGPLFMCIIVDQMKALRDGDRFWYENENVFTSNQLKELKKTNLAKIMCENSENIEMIQKDVFLNAKYPNEMFECSKLEDVSLEPWKNCCENNAKGLCGEPAYFYLPNEIIN
jgi:peroxidase